MSAYSETSFFLKGFFFVPDRWSWCRPRVDKERCTPFKSLRIRAPLIPVVLYIKYQRNHGCPNDFLMSHGFLKTYFTCILIVLSEFKNIMKFSSKNNIMKYVGKTLQVVVLKTWILHKETSFKMLKIVVLTPGSIYVSIENKWISILLDLSSFIDLEFSNLIFGLWWHVFSRVSFFNLLDDIKTLFYSRHYTQRIYTLLVKLLRSYAP